MKKSRNVYCCAPCFRRSRKGVIPSWLATKSVRIKQKKSVKSGSENGAWKGDKVGYSGLHLWVRSKKKIPSRCQNCGKKEKLDLSNNHNQYDRDLKNWEYLCRKCHTEKDGTIKMLDDFSRAKKIYFPIPCLVCKKKFQPSFNKKKFCSMDCYQKVRLEKNKETIGEEESKMTC